MLSLSIIDVKDFMGKLLKTDTFDAFELHSFCLHNYAVFEINKLPDEPVVLWAKLRPYAFEMVKGNKLPSYMKVVLARPKNEDTMFLNIVFDEGKITITSGMGQKVFSMDKSIYRSWNEYIIEFLQKKGIAFINQMEGN